MKSDKISTVGVSKRFAGQWHLSILIPVLLLVVLYWPAFGWMNERFFEENSYYSHGWLIPVAIGFLLWQKREALAGAAIRPCWGGFLVLVSGLGLHLFAGLVGVNFLSGWALLITLIGLSLFNWGTSRTRLLICPLLLMVFMIPLPGVWVIAITFRFKTISAAVGIALARLLGIPIIFNGFEIVLPSAPPGEVLRIGDPCSGLRTLLSFGALGSFFALLLPCSPTRRLLVFGTAVLLAPVSNVVRVLCLVLLRQTIGPQILSGPWHVALGLLLFFLFFLLFLQVIRWQLR